MPLISSLDLARRLSNAQPSRENAKLAANAFKSVQEEHAADENSVPAEGGKGRLVEVFRELSKHGSKEVPVPALVLATSFLSASGTEEELREVPLDVLTRQTLSLAALHPTVDLNDAHKEGSGLSKDIRVDVANVVYDGSNLSEDMIASITGDFPVFRVPTEFDENFASRVLSSSPLIFSDEPLAFRSSVAMMGLDIDSDGPDAGRAIIALSNLSADFSKSDKIPSPEEIGIRVASDIATQSRAARLLDSDFEGSLGAEAEIRNAMLVNSDMRSEIEIESKGQYFKLSRGSAMDVRSDISSGEALDPVFRKLIAASISSAASHIDRIIEISDNQGRQISDAPSQKSTANPVPGGFDLASAMSR